jgi:metal-responsive CopG/Arc/MetJ family transcriptional regulator
MADVTQVAFQLDNESLRRIDQLAASESSSRAEVLRGAVRELLGQRRDAAIDEQHAAGYAASPPALEEEAFAELSVEGLRAADLDW